MGIKILGGISPGVAPTITQLSGERELAFNTTDGKLYTNIGDVIKTVSSDNGVIWATGKGYKLGDIVSDSGALYICLSDHTASAVFTTDVAEWKLVSSDSVSTIYNPSLDYNEGDVVIVDGELYVAPVGGISAEPWDPTSWIAVSSKDIGGRAWDATLATAGEYKAGDIVTNNSLTYFSISGGDTTPGAFDPTDWTEVGKNEVAGKLFDIAKSYLIGDIVTYDDGDSTKSYRAIADSPIPSSAWIPGSWELENITGNLWNATYTYMAGDIVTDGGPVAFLYICENDGTTGGVLTDTTNWQKYGVIHYNATTGGIVGDNPGAATPNPSIGGVEHYPVPNTYPDTTLETVGARWVIKGLGWDVNGNKISTSLPGTTGVVDGDIITWVNGVTGSESWLWTPSPRIEGVRTGMTWRDGETYLDGDIVSSLGDVYLAIAAPTNGVGFEPENTPSEWELQDGDSEVGGIAWGLGTTYVIGDTVTELGGLYTCTAGHTALTGDVGDGSPTRATQANWDYVQSKPEVGGVGYDGTTTSYDLGTVVGFDAAGIPGSTTEAAGEVLYVANQAAANPGILAHWTLLETSPEVGGIAHQPAPFVYVAGDVVVGTDGKLFRNLTGTNGALPATEIEATTDWTNDIIVDPGKY